MKDNKFIWISGSINAGKSTIAANIHKLIKKSVNIECDVLRHFAENDSLRDIGNFVLVDALDLAKKWSERDYLPILTWPLYGQGLEDMLSYSKKLDLEPVLINLTTDKNIAKQNRGERELTEWELNRIEYMYATENIHKPKLGFIIDNSNQSLAQTTAEVMESIKDIVKHYL